MKAIVHVGMGKTGSSTLQATLAANRARLAEDGCLYPVALGNRINHNGLRSCFQSERLPRTARGAAAIDTAAYLAALDPQFAETDCSTVILSSELLFYMGRAGIQTMERFLTERFNEIVVVAYIRDPVSYYLSAQQQQVKASGQIDPPGEVKSPIRSSLSRFRQIFGDRLRVRSAGRSALIGQCIVQDFLASQVDPVKEPESITVLDRNESLSAEGICVIQELRRDAWPGADHKFDDATKQVLRMLGVIREELDGQTRPVLKPAIHAYLEARFTADYAWLEEHFGLAFARAGQVADGGAGIATDGSPLLRDMLEVRAEDIDRTKALLARRLAEALKR